MGPLEMAPQSEPGERSHSVQEQASLLEGERALSAHSGEWWVGTCLRQVKLSTFECCSCSGLWTVSMRGRGSPPCDSAVPAAKSTMGVGVSRPWENPGKL